MDRNARDLSKLAFGTEPGADPAPGLSTGHWAWANDLRIPEMVEDCLHMVAAHELRNSFPVDSLSRDWSTLPIAAKCSIPEPTRTWVEAIAREKELEAGRMARS